MIEAFTSENEFGRGEVRSWASLLDDNCREQAEAISRVPVVRGHLALMPDAHFGFGPPVGSALVTERAVMPYAVGVDIGCGMIAVRTDLPRDRFSEADSRQVLGQIRDLIPSGVGKSHRSPLPQAARFFHEHGGPPSLQGDSPLRTKQGLLVDQRTSLTDRARIQFGTLGSGNHFVEVCADRDGAVWLLLHSGSRGIGNVLATAHVQAAQEFADAEGIALENREFAYVLSGTAPFRAYLDDMLWAQRYAFQQREAMMDGLIEAVRLVIGEFETEPAINCHHNYAEEIEPDTWLVRKGAINAEQGRLGIIPGSMGAATYIVRGKGNAESYMTSPHGAGRQLGRGQARRQLDLEEFKRQMVGRTWLDRDAKQLLDEAPSAYKPIETVIEDSAELIEPVTMLSQFINYKGL